MPICFMIDTFGRSTLDTNTRIDVLSEVSQEVRDRVAEQIRQGEGTVEDVVRQLATALGKNVIFKLSEQTKPQNELSRLSILKKQYEELSVMERTCSKGVMTWEQVMKAIPDEAEFLALVESLSEPEVYWIDQNDQLVIGDGCAEPAQETLNLSYTDSRSAATLFNNRGLITLDEYNRRWRKRWPKDRVKKWSWVESGKNPAHAKSVFWTGKGKAGKAHSNEFKPSLKSESAGSFRVIRFKMDV